MSVLKPLPFNRALVITPSDTVNFSTTVNRGYCDAVYVGGAGVVVAVFEDDTTIAFTCIAGQILPVKAKRVNSTSTTATLLRALFWM